MTSSHLVFQLGEVLPLTQLNLETSLMVAVHADSCSQICLHVAYVPYAQIQSTEKHHLNAF
jgi:hypothetical protein